jgi:hypothetical protein
MVFWCGSHSAPSGSRKSYTHSSEAELPDTCAAVCKVFACLLLHSVVCPLECHTSGSSIHLLTTAKRFYRQGMLHGILGGDSHGFVHGISLRHYIYIVTDWVIAGGQIGKHFSSDLHPTIEGRPLLGDGWVNTSQPRMRNNRKENMFSAWSMPSSYLEDK